MERIAVAMSGGVDSTTAAFLLKREGHDVFGLHFITGFEPANEAQNGFAILSEKLRIPIETIDLRQDFKKQVVDYFIDTYRNGKTPNPCLKCNAGIKFGVLPEHARRMAADALATGHYARLGRGADGNPRLLRGMDPVKDQSYFLAFLSPAQLSAARFPLGHMTKKQVRDLARQNGLEPMIPSESQDVCFIRDGSYTEFLMHHGNYSPEPGPITDIHGRIIGRHEGLHGFTIGQRRGINCPAREPYYVIRIDVSGNTLVVGSRTDLHTRSMQVREINWIERPGTREIRVATQIRYRRRAAESQLILREEGDAEVIFDDPQEAVTPGQAAVFYRDDRVIGGGIIEAS